MRQLSPTAKQAINDLAQRYGFSSDAVLSMLQSVINRHGSMAQFSHPEFIRAKGSGNSEHRGGQFENLRNRIEAMNEGAFSPFLQQPYVGAALLPLGSFSLATVLGRGILGF
jgi:hypothetical protein